MEHLVGTATHGSVSLFDLVLDLNAGTRAERTGTVQEVGELHLRVLNRRDTAFPPVIGTALHDEVSLRKVLQTLDKRLASVEHLRDGGRIRTR